MNENKRRKFLKTLTFGSLIFTQISHAKNEKKVRYGILFDQNNCVACTKCEIACQKVNKVPLGQYRMIIEDQTNPNDRLNKRYLRASCQQCLNAPCINVCPTKASHRDAKTNIVTMTKNDCIGCGYCIVACPYDVRFINKQTKAAENCNLCLDTNLSKDQQPACVQACKYKALYFGDINDENSYISRLSSTKSYVYIKSYFGTKPSLRYIPALKRGVKYDRT